MSNAEGVFISARSCAEYEGMFGLEFAQWQTKHILDCGAGGASFAAEWSAAGGTAMACDPMYSEPFTVQVELVHRGVDRAARNIVEEPKRYLWDVFQTPEHHKAARERAAETFLTDLREHPDRYVPGRLPRLPFKDRTFDLVLSSHLLFVYSHTLSLEDHLAYVIEMTRVAIGEVRIYPLVGFEDSADDLVRHVISELQRSGLNCERRLSSYHFLQGATEYLAIRC